MGQSSIASTAHEIYLSFNTVSLKPQRYVDIAQCLSIINRRSYRQGMNYAVAKVEVFSPDGGNLGIFTVPTTWVADNATTKAYKHWEKQRQEVLDEQPSMKAKWSDFKVFMDATHAVAGVADNLTPVNMSATPALYLLGDWDASEMVFPVTGGSGGTAAANQQTMHVLGDNVPVGNFTVAKTSFSLIEAYANSRRTPQSPDPSTTGVSTTTNPYATLASSDSKYQDIAENLLEHNKETPYDLDDYPGGELNAPNPQWVGTAILNDYGDATAWSSSRCDGFIAPFGLLQIDTTSFEDDTAMNVVITLVPGSYKGILAEKGV